MQCSLHLSGTIILLRSLRVGKLQRSVGKDEKRFPKARDDAWEPAVIYRFFPNFSSLCRASPFPEAPHCCPLIFLRILTAVNLNIYVEIKFCIITVSGKSKHSSQTMIIDKVNTVKLSKDLSSSLCAACLCSEPTASSFSERCRRCASSQPRHPDELKGLKELPGQATTVLPCN